MLDYHDIRKLLHTYSHGCDRHDSIRMTSVYAENSWDDHGPNKMPGKEFVNCIMETMSTSVEMVSHLLGQSLINITNDTAGAETTFVVTMRRLDPEKQEVLDQMGGRYIDTLIREKDSWKILKRVCVRDWSISHSVKMDQYKFAGFVEGLRTGDDLSFEALGIVHSNLPDLRGRD